MHGAQRKAYALHLTALDMSTFSAPRTLLVVEARTLPHQSCDLFRLCKPAALPSKAVAPVGLGKGAGRSAKEGEKGTDLLVGNRQALSSAQWHSNQSPSLKCFLA